MDALFHFSCTSRYGSTYSEQIKTWARVWVLERPYKLSHGCYFCPRMLAQMTWKGFGVSVLFGQKNVLTYLFQCFSRSLVQFRWKGGWGFGGLCLMRNALKALNPGIHAVWLWANGLLFQKCQGGLFLCSKISSTFLKESGFHKNRLSNWECCC